MQITIIQTGEVPDPLLGRFGPYPAMFKRMLDSTGHQFEVTVVPVFSGAPMPDPGRCEAILITGSSAGVYDDIDWLDPLRAFIRRAYAARTPTVGICFGHQIMADALGGKVRKSEKGWGLGRHTYAVTEHGTMLGTVGDALSIACSHQDQVIGTPPDAKVILASAFTPNAGLVYANGAAISVQPHPEFEDGLSAALAQLRRGQVADALVDEAIASFAIPSDSPDLASSIAEFLLASRPNTPR